MACSQHYRDDLMNLDGGPWTIWQSSEREGFPGGFNQLLEGGADGYHIVDYVSRLMLFPKRA